MACWGLTPLSLNAQEDEAPAPFESSPALSAPASGGTESQPVAPLAGQDSPAGTGESPAGAGESSDDDFGQLFLGNLLVTPMVESASRYAQSLDEAPSSITVITAEEIEASGAIYLFEVLRRVPGLFVLQTQANAASVGLRGINHLENKGVLVLVDGRQMNQFINGQVDWGALGVQPGDVSRIEVIRGPGSIVFGANAFNGVINILTKDARGLQGLEAHAWGSLQALSDNPTTPSSRAWMQNGGGAYASYNWSDEADRMGLRLTLGLVNAPEWPDQSLEMVHGPFGYSLRASFSARPREDLTLFAALSHSVDEKVQVAQMNTLAYRRENSSQIMTFRLEKQRFFLEPLSLRFQADARRNTAATRTRFAVGGVDISEALQQDLESYDAHTLLLLNASLWGDRDQLSVGGELTYNAVKPTLVFGGLILTNDLHLLPDRSLLLSAGIRWEQIRVDAPDKARILYRHVIPRLSLIWKMAPEHALRLSATTAFRTPLPWETLLDMFQPPAEGSPVPSHYIMVGNPQLRPENLRSIELGYRGLLARALRLDSVAFAQEARDLIGSSGEIGVPAYLENLRSIYQFGVELNLRFVPTQLFSAYLNYAFTYTRDQETETSLQEWPVHLCGLGIEWRLPWRTRLNADAYLVFNYEPVVSSFSTPNSRVYTVVFLPTQAPEVAWIDLRVGRFFYLDRAELFLAVKNVLGFFRDPVDLRMYPSPAIQPIGGTLLLGLNVKGI